MQDLFSLHFHPAVSDAKSFFTIVVSILIVCFISSLNCWLLDDRDCPPFHFYIH